MVLPVSPVPETPAGPSTEQSIRRVAMALDMGADIESIRTMLLETGLTEEQAYLVYSAARLYGQGNARDRARGAEGVSPD